MTISTSIVNSFKAARDSVSSEFVGRDTEIRAILAAMVAGQHVYMLGPPGTGKSALSRSIASTLSATCFDYLFSRTTTVDEVFGPLDLQALKVGQYKRITKGLFADTVVAFVDEIGKANSTVQNSMLTAINERIYNDGTGNKKIPLRTVLAASNELPDPKESGAFMDRFLVRLYVDDSATKRDDWLSVVTGEKSARSVEASVSLEEWATATNEAEQVSPDGALEALWRIRADLEAREIKHTARRWKAVVSLCKASAWLDGREATTARDAAIAEHCLWRFPKEREIVSQIVADHSAGQAGEARKLAEGARKLMSQLDSNSSAFEDIARVVREVGHVVSQIRAMGEQECDELAALLEREIDGPKRSALARLGL